MYEFSRQIYRELAREIAPPLGMTRRDAGEAPDTPPVDPRLSPAP